MGQQQNLEQIREETAMESIMAGMESGEYFSQLQLQSPLLPQTPFSQMQSSQHQHQHEQRQQATPMMTPQFDYAAALSVSTPLLASQTQTVYDMTGVSDATSTPTPTIPSSTLMSVSMDGSINYG
ncbi:hypothetical protein BGZ98_003280, partial [Dissophora globulifera]